MFKKQYFYLIAFAASGLMAACTSATNTDEPDKGSEMRFIAGEASRASLVTNSSLNSFAVYGNMVSNSNPSTPSVVFDNTAVTLADGKWTYTDTQYWIPGQTYSFAAVHFPSTDNISNLTYSDDKLSFRYTAPTDYTLMDDILTAVHRRKYTSGTTTPIALGFGHIMARVNFIANVDAAVPNAEVTLNSISISGVATRANYTLQPAPLAGTNMTSDLVAPAWTISSTPTRVTYTKALGITLAAGQSASLFDMSADPLLIIPQTITSDIEVQISYTKQNGSTEVVTGRLRTVTGSHGYQWSAGRAYSYSFTLGLDDYLIFNEPDIKGWDNDAGGNYIVVG